MSNENWKNLSEEQKAGAVGETLRSIDGKIAETVRGGRKPKSPRKRRDKVVHVRFNADEYEMFQKYQEEDGDDMAVLVREFALKELRRYFKERERVRAALEESKKRWGTKPRLGQALEAWLEGFYHLKKGEEEVDAAPEGETLINEEKETY